MSRSGSRRSRGFASGTRKGSEAVWKPPRHHEDRPVVGPALEGRRDLRCHGALPGEGPVGLQDLLGGLETGGEAVGGDRAGESHRISVPQVRLEEVVPELVGVPAAAPPGELPHVAALGEAGLLQQGVEVVIALLGPSPREDLLREVEVDEPGPGPHLGPGPERHQLGREVAEGVVGGEAGRLGEPREEALAELPRRVHVGRVDGEGRPGLLVEDVGDQGRDVLGALDQDLAGSRVEDPAPELEGAGGAVVADGDEVEPRLARRGEGLEEGVDRVPDVGGVGGEVGGRVGHAVGPSRFSLS